MDQGDGGTDLKSLQADVVLCPWQDTDFHQTIWDRTDTSQIFSDLLRFKYPNDNIVMMAGQYREAPWRHAVLSPENLVNWSGTEPCFFGLIWLNLNSTRPESKNLGTLGFVLLWRVLFLQVRPMLAQGAGAGSWVDIFQVETVTESLSKLHKSQVLFARQRTAQWINAEHHFWNRWINTSVRSSMWPQRHTVPLEGCTSRNYNHETLLRLLGTSWYQMSPTLMFASSRPISLRARLCLNLYGSKKTGKPPLLILKDRSIRPALFGVRFLQLQYLWIAFLLDQFSSIRFPFFNLSCPSVSRGD